MVQQQPPSSARGFDPAVGFVILFLTAAVIRLIWWHFGPKVIENEGVYYARIAQNLAAGRGMVGLTANGTQLLYPPLYPSLISLGVRLGMGAETAGRMISLLFGSGLAVVCGLFARRYYDSAAGWFAGIIVALHPLLIALSTAVLSESTDITLTVLTLYWVVDALELGKRRSAILAGVCLGLAYLTRPEALIAACLFSLLAVALNMRRWRPAAVRSGLLMGVFAVFAVPYIAFLSYQTDQFHFEVKTEDGISQELAEKAGETWGPFYFSINQKLQDTGEANISDLAMVQRTHASPVQCLRMSYWQVRSNLPRLIRAVGSAEFGAPFLTVLAALGIFVSPWGWIRWRRELPLIVITGFALLSYLMWPFHHDRFLYPIMPALILWGGLGLARLADWAVASARNVVHSTIVGHLAAAVAVAGMLGAMCAAGAVGVPTSDELSQSWRHPQLREDAVVGRWLGAHALPRVRLMDVGPTAAFYANAVLVPYPWTDGTTALRYIAYKKVDYLILHLPDQRRPYLETWWRNPPSQLELVHTFDGAGGPTRLYRWRSTTP